MKRCLTALVLILILLARPAAAEKESVYRSAGGSWTLFDLDGTGWLVEAPWNDRDPEKTREQAKFFHALAEKWGVKDNYVYLINSSRSIDFDRPEEEPQTWQLLKECYPDWTLGSLEIHSIEEYCGYFYKTDHHWNYKGSYEGYREVIRMLLGEDEPLLEPVETVEFPFTYNGSYNKKLGRTDSDEKFTVFRFEYPEMEVSINLSRRSGFGRARQYFAGGISGGDSYTNHYGGFYGGSNAVLLFSTNRPEKESILIFSNSFSCAVCMLIASHFNNTLVVDTRLFEEEIGTKIQNSRLPFTYGVTKILLLGDAYFFR